MTRRKQAQRTLWEGVVEEDVRALYEPWMIEADRLLEDESLIDGVFTAQRKRHEHSATKGRSQTPAEMVLRLLLLKHVRNWSFDTLEREVRANLVYRDFARIGMGKVPDAKTLARIAQALGGKVIAELHRRLVEIAREEGVIQGRKLRVDTTVVETNIHYPTDSSLLGDGARVLTRTMKKIETRAGQMKRKVRNRMRSISKRVVAIATASRHKGPEGEAKAEEAVSGIVAILAPNSQRRQTGDRGSRRDVHQKEEEAGRIGRTLDGNGGPCSAGGEAGQGAGLRRNDAVAR
jgi:IS5 family transposase